MGGVHRLTAVAIGAAALLAMAACGSSSTSSSSSGSSSAGSSHSSNGGGANVNASMLLTQSAAAQLTGDPNVTELAAGTNANIAIYLDTSASGAGSGATLFVEALPNGVSSAQVQQAIQHAGASGANVQQLSGIGDAAYKEVDANSATVAFVKGTTLVAVRVESASRSGSDLDSALESFAHQVAGSL